MDRFLNKVIKTESCWLWRGAKNKRGYGHFSIGSRKDETRKTVLAHRFSYELFKDRLDPSLVIDHLCKNTSCVNPKHLDQVKHKVNMERASPANKTHCKMGHPRTEKNTKIQNKKNGDTLKSCRICRNLRGKAFYNKNKKEEQLRSKKYYYKNKELLGEKK